MSKISLQPDRISRRDFLKAGLVGSFALLAASIPQLTGCRVGQAKPVVSIVENYHIPTAVEKAIDLLGGMGMVAADKEHIMLKPNLVEDRTRCTTKLEVIR